MIELHLNDLGPSLNEWYGKGHWTKRAALAKYWHALVAFAVRDQGISKINKPVILTMIFEHGKSQMLRDVSNCAAAAKLVEDGLVRAGVLEDDSPQYVHELRMRPIKSIDGRRRTIVYIEEA